MPPWLAACPCRRRQLRGHTVYSKNFKSDLWLHLKNKQIFISLFFVHPQHPFSRSERISALVVSCVLAWGLEAWFCAVWSSCEEHPELNFVQLFVQVLLLKIAVSAILNGEWENACALLLEEVWVVRGGADAAMKPRLAPVSLPRTACVSGVTPGPLRPFLQRSHFL